ncbi:MAG: hypothetical protein CMJ78_00080 [Planctomycetaceae bacterium]|nr:hypothetical protein [Planctomycetaceae bacterium]
MPIKVRCDCGKAISAPDAARGKAIKCPDCGERVRVPAGQRKKKKKKKRVVERRPDDDDFFSGLDDEALEDTSIRICPKCTAEVDEEDIECPECGVNIETGQLSAKQRKKRKMRGPDPSEFYSVVWKDSFEFLKKNMKFAVRTGIYWTIFGILYVGSAFMAGYCEKPPLIAFWAGLAVIFYLTMPGWLWSLHVHVVKCTLEQQEGLGKFNFDMFSCVSWGIKYFFWPLVIVSPLLLVPTVIAVVGGIPQDIKVLASDDAVTGGLMAMLAPVIGLTSVLYVLPIFFFPVASSHMAAKYTYPGWLPIDLIKNTFKHFGGVAYYWVIFIAVHLHALIVVGLLTVFGTTLVAYVSDLVLRAIEAILGPDELSGFTFVSLVIAFAALIAFLTITPMSFSVAFPSVFMMRVNGLFAHYNKRTLGYVTKQKPGVPAGFWVRYLAIMVDFAVLTMIFLTLVVLLYPIAAVYVAFGAEEGVTSIIAWFGFVRFATLPYWVVFPLLYFGFQECGNASGSLGKNAIGLIVVDHEGKKPITQGASFIRAFLRVLCGLPAFVGWIVAAFGKKQTLHDMATKTQVVWRGDQ